MKAKEAKWFVLASALFLIYVIISTNDRWKETLAMPFVAMELIVFGIMWERYP